MGDATNLYDQEVYEFCIEENAYFWLFQPGQDMSFIKASEFMGVEGGWDVLLPIEDALGINIEEFIAEVTNIEIPPCFTTSEDLWVYP